MLHETQQARRSTGSGRLDGVTLGPSIDVVCAFAHDVNDALASAASMKRPDPAFDQAMTAFFQSARKADCARLAKTCRLKASAQTA